jgi:membrane carboxypeptidase/penicillin-binding protein
LREQRRRIGGGRARGQDYWSPKNYDGGGTLTLRRALETRDSRNLATVHLPQGGIEGAPEASLDRLCKLALETQLYRECLRYYPFVLGAQPVRPVDPAAFYAAIANEGLRPSPHVIVSIERNGLVVHHHDPKASVMIGCADRNQRINPLQSSSLKPSGAVWNPVKLFRLRSQRTSDAGFRNALRPYSASLDKLFSP